MLFISLKEDILIKFGWMKTHRCEANNIWELFQANTNSSIFRTKCNLKHFVWVWMTLNLKPIKLKFLTSTILYQSHLDGDTRVDGTTSSNDIMLDFGVQLAWKCFIHHNKIIDNRKIVKISTTTTNIIWPWTAKLWSFPEKFPSGTMDGENWVEDIF